MVPCRELIPVLCRKGYLDMALNVLMRLNVAPSIESYLCLLKLCTQKKALFQIKQVQAHISHSKIQISGRLGDYLVVSLARCGAPDDALSTLLSLPFRTVFSWTATISGYTDNGDGSEALRLYKCMLEDGIQCDEYTYVSLFKACGNTIDLEHGMCLHIEAAKKGFTSDVYVRSTLISMYGKCDALAEAENIFFGMLEHTVVSWNAMLSAYVEQRHGDSALQLFVQMQITGVNPSYLTFVIALQACLTLLDRWRDSFDGDTFCKAVVLDVGQALHSDAARRNLLSNKFVCSMLVTLYGRCGEVSKAEHAYCFLPEYSLVSCTSLLSAYVDHGHTEKALLFYVEMEKWGVVWDHVMITCVLQACSLSGNLEICKHLHFIIVSAGYDDVLPLVATLIHCYGNCAYMVDGQVCFDGLPESNLVLWNACISAHAAEGNLFACLDMFENLSLVGLLPDGVTFNSALCACSHSGHFLRGLEYFSLMIDHYYLTPDMKHYGSILDLLARAGNFKLVKHVLQSMTFPADLSVWLCLLGACRVHGNLQLARQAFHEAIALQPKQDTAYVVMSGFYEDRTLWEGISASYEE